MIHTTYMNHMFAYYYDYDACTYLPLLLYYYYVYYHETCIYGYYHTCTFISDDQDYIIHLFMIIIHVRIACHL